MSALINFAYIHIFLTQETRFSDKDIFLQRRDLTLSHLNYALFIDLLAAAYKMFNSKSVVIAKLYLAERTKEREEVFFR